MYMQNQQYAAGAHYMRQPMYSAPPSTGARYGHGEVPIRLAPREKEPESSGCSTCCCVVMVILAVLAAVFFLNFSGVIPFGYEGESISGDYEGLAYSVALEYKGPWGTKFHVSLDGETVFSHYFWFTNIYAVARQEQTLSSSQAFDAFKSFMETFPKWLDSKSRLMKILDAMNAQNPEYHQQRPSIEVLSNFLLKFPYKKILDLVSVENQPEKLTEAKNVFTDYVIGYLKRGKLDALIPAEHRPLYFDFKSLLLRHYPNTRNATSAHFQETFRLWNTVQVQFAAGNIEAARNAYLAMEQNSEVYAPGMSKDLRALFAKHQTNKFAKTCHDFYKRVDAQLGIVRQD